jgi:hypothetical protein
MEIATYVAQAVTLPVSDTVATAALATVGVLGAAYLNTRRAQRGAEKDNIAPTGPGTIPAAATADDGGLALSKWIVATIETAVEKAVEERTRPLRRQVAILTASVTVLRRTVRHLRKAFREYVREVESTWGKAEAPPKVSDSVLAMLYDDDLDDEHVPLEHYMDSESTRPDNNYG